MSKYTFNGPADADKYTTVTVPNGNADQKIEHEAFTAAHKEARDSGASGDSAHETGVAAQLAMREKIARRRAMRERWGDRAPSIPSDYGAGLWLVRVEE